MNPLPRAVVELCRRIEPVGSRVTCNPAPTDTDADYLAFVQPALWGQLRAALDANGFESHPAYETPESPPSASFRSFRNGDVNVITTCEEWFFNRFMAATSLAKRFNLLRKDDRIALFQAVLYGREVEQ